MTILGSGVLCLAAALALAEGDAVRSLPDFSAKNTENGAYLNGGVGKTLGEELINGEKIPESNK